MVNKLDKLVSYNRKADDGQNKKGIPKYKGDEEYKELFHEM